MQRGASACPPLACTPSCTGTVTIDFSQALWWHERAGAAPSGIQGGTEHPPSSLRRMLCL